MNVMTVNVWPYPGRAGEFCGQTDESKPHPKGAFIAFIGSRSVERIRRRAEEYAGGPVEVVMRDGEPAREAA